jgi:DNA repair protein SbcD/Mre11
MIRFIHAADIHLDSPLRGLGRYEGAPVAEIRGAARRALDNLVQLAVDEAVHFVVIAGDVFDGDWPDVSTGLFFVKQMGRLRDRGVNVYVISGNHDAANKMTRRLPYPENVHLFRADSPETERLENIHVAIHGQSYAEQSEIRNLATNYPEPLDGCFNIGLLHTSLDGREGHERYAPCQLEELVARGYDYWALGHVHQRESVNGDRRPLVEFPGNIQGRHARETGAKGCLLVQVANDNSTTVTFRALDVLRWEQVIVDCSRLDELEAVVARVCAKLFDSWKVIPGRTNLRPVAFAPPKPTGLLNGEGLLSRDSESFGSKFRGAKPTLMVGSEPRSASLETESAGPACGSPQTLATKGQKRETPGGRSLGAGR